MRVCILSAGNVKHMAMITQYTERLRRDGIAFDLVYHDKYGVDETLEGAQAIYFTRGSSKTRAGKLRDLMGFKRRAIRLLDSTPYDFVVVWSDVTILLLGPYLARKYRGRYCLNIRDYFFERVPGIRGRFRRSIKGAAFTTVSSLGFLSFLPQHEYVHLPSYNPQAVGQSPRRGGLRQPGEPIRVSFIGNIRFFKQNEEILTAFANDSRFELRYHGLNAERLATFAQNAGIQNAVFSGSFDISETSRHLAQADVINNLYGHHSVPLDTALSIKFCHGVRLHLPILGFSNTYTAQLIQEYGVGFVTDVVDATLPDRFHAWYRAQDAAAWNNRFGALERYFIAELEGFTEAYDIHIRERS